MSANNKIKANPERVGGNENAMAEIVRNAIAGDGIGGRGIYHIECVGPRPEIKNNVVDFQHYLDLRRMRDALKHSEDQDLYARVLEEMAPMEEIKWREVIANKTVTVGLNDILDKYWSGSSYTAAFYMLLINSTMTAADADTMSSHSGWTENVAYSQSTRPAPSFGSAAAGVKATSSAVAFSITSDAQTIAGVGIATVSTKSGTTGVLVTAGPFTGGDKAVDNGDTLNVSYSYTVTSSN